METMSLPIVKFDYFVFKMIRFSIALKKPKIMKWILKLLTKFETDLYQYYKQLTEKSIPVDIKMKKTLLRELKLFLFMESTLTDAESHYEKEMQASVNRVVDYLYVMIGTILENEYEVLDIDTIKKLSIPERNSIIRLQTGRMYDYYANDSEVKEWDAVQDLYEYEYEKN